MRKIKTLAAIFGCILLLTACSNQDTTNISSNIDNTSMPAFTNTYSEPDVPQTSEPQKPIQTVPPQALETGKTVTVSGELENQQYSSKIDELQNILNGHSYNISLAVYSVDGSKYLAYNTEAEIFGACTVKAAYTLYSCKQMESGIGSLQTELAYQEKHYEPGTGDMQYSPFGTVFTMQTALHKSMSISDNVGYLMSVDFFGRDGYNAYMHELGCDSLQIKPTVWSLRTKADDLVRIWCEIYNYFATDTEYARFLKSSCTNTSGNYATEALSGIDYSHKQGHNSTGDWLSFSDAGIVWKGDTPYIVAILTDAPGPNSYSKAEFAKIIDIVHNELF